MERDISQLQPGDPKLQEYFTIDRYIGLWYEICRSKNITFEGDFLKESYTKDGPTTIGTHFSHVVNGKEDKGEGIATFDPSRPAQWSMKIKKYLFTRLFTFDYRIIETDYDNYSIVLSRNKFLWFFKKEYIWIMGRRKTLDDKILQHCFEVIEKETHHKQDFLEMAKQ